MTYEEKVDKAITKACTENPPSTYDESLGLVSVLLNNAVAAYLTTRQMAQGKKFPRSMIFNLLENVTSFIASETDRLDVEKN